MMHSKAPFSVYERPEKTIFDEDISLTVVDADGFKVATFDTMAISRKWQRENPDKIWYNYPESYKERMPEEVVANASLFSAAPDLLKACRELLGLIERMPNASAILAPYSAGAKIAAQSKAAIAKAEGEGVE